MNSETPFRFVVLHHTGVAEAHFDLLVDWHGEEAGGLLATWRIVRPPHEWAGDVEAVRIPDHRRVYLTYEGEISGGRGEVRRVADGTGEVVSAEEGRMRVRLNIAGTTREVILPG